MTENHPAERILRLRQSVAKEYGIDADDWRARRLALLLSLHAAAEDQSATGDPVDIGNLLALDKAIEDVRSSLRLAEPCNIAVHVVERLRGICPLCRGVVEDYTPPPKPVPAPLVEPEAPPVVAKAPPAPPAHSRRPAPVVASAVSPLSFGGGFDPVRHNDSPLLSWGPHPYIRKDTSR
jgi:hypothetical protein